MLSTTFNDIIKKSILKLVPGSIDLTTLLIALLVSLFIGIGIFFVYRKYFIGVVYDHAFSISLVIMTILVTIIIVTISSNITLSLGMVGALSIVRYRTAVKNPLDLMFLFWAVTSGIAIGASYYYVAAISFIFVTLVFVILNKMKSELKTYVLIIKYENRLELEEEVRRSLGQYKSKLRSKIVNNNQVELTIELNLKVENINITNRLSELDGVNDVTLVQYRSSYEL